VVTDDEREHAWGPVHDALAQMPGWAVGPCTYYGEVALWRVAAIDLRPRGRYAKREAITGTGETEIAALVDLHGRLTGMPRPTDDAASWGSGRPGRVRRSKTSQSSKPAASQPCPTRVDEPAHRHVKADG
jgi:hypothetical protein